MYIIRCYEGANVCLVQFYKSKNAAEKRALKASENYDRVDIVKQETVNVVDLSV